MGEHNYVHIYVKINNKTMIENPENVKLKNNTYKKNNSSPLPKAHEKVFSKIQDKTKKCIGCNKDFKNILIHLKRSKTCQACYDMDDLEGQHRVMQRETKTAKQRERRKERDDSEVIKDRLKSKNGIARFRDASDELKR